MIEALRLTAMIALVIVALVGLVRMIQAYAKGNMILGSWMIALVSFANCAVIVIGDLDRRPMNKLLVFVTACAVISSIGASIRLQKQTKGRQ